jgi:hypothetical protein
VASHSVKTAALCGGHREIVSNRPRSNLNSLSKLQSATKSNNTVPERYLRKTRIPDMPDLLDHSGKSRLVAISSARRGVQILSRSIRANQQRISESRRSNSISISDVVGIERPSSEKSLSCKNLSSVPALVSSKWYFT